MNDPGQGPAASADGDETAARVPDSQDQARDVASPDAPAHRPAAVLSLKQAMRRARFDDAERSGAVADLRLARLGRLDVLQDALRPLIAQIPADIDCFDVGIMPGANPRLFIDMIGFVEMGRDPRVYRFLQDTRHGRVVLAESETIEVIVEAATHYVARRLLERDKALASDSDDEPPPRRTPRDPADPRPLENTSQPPAPWSLLSVLSAVFAFLVDILGSIAFFLLLAFAGWVIWSNLKH